MKKLILYLLAVSVIWGSTACSNHQKNDKSDAETELQTPQETKEDETERYDYSEYHIEFVSNQDKSVWRDDLVAFLSKNVDWDDERYKDNPDAYIEKGYDVALFDVDLDGTPEIIINYGGGSAGNKYLKIFDLKTHECLGSFTGGYNTEDEWSCFYDLQTKEIKIFGEYYLREGWDILRYYICTLEYKNVSEMYQGYTEVPYLSNCRRLRSVSDEVGVYTYYMNEEEISEVSYENERRNFLNRYVKIPVTAIELIDWDTDENLERTPEEMADAILGSSQAFIKISS